MNALLVELPVTHLRPMASSSYVGSTWFYVVFILAVTITLGLCIKKLKIIKKSWEVYAVVVTGQVVEKGVAMEMRKIPLRMFRTVV